MNNIERELKMLLNKTEYEELLQAGRTEPQLQVNYYFRYDGMPADIMLRIRETNGKYLFCYKRLLTTNRGVNDCDERERNLTKDEAKRFVDCGLTPDDIKKLVDVDLPSVCKCVGSLKTYRAKFMLDKWLVELDKNEYLGTTDYELECEGASYELLGKLTDYLRRYYAIAFRPSLSKSARFFNKLFDDK